MNPSLISHCAFAISIFASTLCFAKSAKTLSALSVDSDAFEEAHVVKKFDSMSIILYRRGLGRAPYFLYGKKGWLKRNIDRNPQLKNPNRIRPGTSLNLILPKGLRTQNKDTIITKQTTTETPPQPTCSFSRPIFSVALGSGAALTKETSIESDVSSTLFEMGRIHLGYQQYCDSKEDLSWYQRHFYQIQIGAGYVPPSGTTPLSPNFFGRIDFGVPLQSDFFRSILFVRAGADSNSFTIATDSGTLDEEGSPIINISGKRNYSAWTGLGFRFQNQYSLHVGRSVVSRGTPGTPLSTSPTLYRVDLELQFPIFGDFMIWCEGTFYRSFGDYQLQRIQGLGGIRITL